MKKVEELIQNHVRYKNAIVQKKFKSKKNTVCYVTLDGKPRILKWFAPGFTNNFIREYTILKQASSTVLTPFAFECDERNNVILMNYIIGENVCDVLNDEKTTISEKQRILILLAEWLYNFHLFFKTQDTFIIRGDSILRNFILTDRIWGVDFEESRAGNPIEDVAVLCASLLSTDPMFTKEKVQLFRIFVRSYETLMKKKFSHINNDIAYALLERIQWRPQDEYAIRNFAEQLRKNKW